MQLTPRLEKNNLGWSRDAVDDVGANFIAALTDCLWYIDGHQTKESTLAVIKRGNCPSSSVKERFLVVHPAANYVYF